jgi:predicted transcriptional regulator
LSFNRKRDRIQIIAEILSSCRSPQTQTYIRRQTNVSYVVLQSCIKQLLVRQWLEQTKDNSQKKLATTPKGFVFLRKWVELQNLTGFSSRRTATAPLSERSAIKMISR